MKNFSVMWTRGFGKKKGRPDAVAFLEYLEELPDEALGLFLVLAVSLAGEGPPGPMAGTSTNCFGISQ